MFLKRTLSALTALVITVGLMTCIVLPVKTEAASSIPDDAFAYNGSSYKVYDKVCETWEEAKEYCENLGGHLATITSKEENAAVHDYLLSTGLTNAYFGLTDAEEDGVWKWVTGEQVEYTNWARVANEPGLSTVDKYAMFTGYHLDGTWIDNDFCMHDETKGDRKTFICEWDIGIDDSSIEVKLYNGHSYKVYEQGLTWEEAKTYCENLGGHLITITTEGEQAFIEEVLTKYYKNNYWIGSQKVDKKFVWITGEEFSYENWSSMQPDNSIVAGGEDKVHLYNALNPNTTSHIGGWNDLRNDGTHGTQDFFGLNNFGFICEWEYTIDNESTDQLDPFSKCFADYLEGYWVKTSNVAMPCEIIIHDGGKASLYWNTFLQACEAVMGGQIIINEYDYYEAILLDLISDTYSSVNYEKEVLEDLEKVLKDLTDYVIKEGIDATKTNLNETDFSELKGEMTNYLEALDTTLECSYSFIEAGENAADILEKVSMYVTALQKNASLIHALKMMKNYATDSQPLTTCLNNLIKALSMTPEDVAKSVAANASAKKTIDILRNNVIDGIKEVFPYFDAVEKIYNLVDFSANVIFPTTSGSEQIYRIYAIYHIETVARASFKQACTNYYGDRTISNAETLLSCYDMFVRLYEHEIAESKALSKLIYEKGILNTDKNFFSTKSQENYQSVKDWIDTFNINLDIMKEYKENAYLERGLNSDLLKIVRLVSVSNGKIVGSGYQIVNKGDSIEVPDLSFINFYSKLSLNPLIQKMGEFEGWYHDEECTIPCMASAIHVNAHTVLYAKFNMNNAKQIQVKCPVNVKIYNDADELLLNIENDEVIENPGNLYVDIKDSVKTIIVPQESDYKIKIYATDAGQMNYSVTEISEGVTQRRVNFYNIPLYEGQVFDGSIEKDFNIPESNYALSSKNEQGEVLNVLPDDDLSESDLLNVKVTAVSIGDGKASSGSIVTKGDWFVVEATPDDGAEFMGWYQGDKLISTESVYGFIATENIVLTAVFSPYTAGYEIANLAFSGASFTLQDNLVINYKVDKSLFEDEGYKAPYVIFDLNGVETVVSEYRVDGDKYIFDFTDIAPHQMNDTIKATLYATYNGVEFCSEPYEYRIACTHKNITVVSAKQSTCTEQGNDVYTKCNDCNVLISGSDVKLPLETHIGGTATCKNMAICSVCGVEYGEKLSHTFGDYISNNDGTKTATCTVCGYKNTISVEEIKFIDVAEKDWYHDAVYYAVRNGMMDGTSADTFEPKTELNRATFVTILAKVAGVYDSLDKNTKTVFVDVPIGKWYSGAVAWAVKENITTGTSSATFEPLTKITREAMCTMLVRYATAKGIKLDTSVNAKEAFKDDMKISGWAKEAVYTCQMAGLVNGLGDGNFGPRETAIRAQAAKIFMEFHKSYLVK